MNILPSLVTINTEIADMILVCHAIVLDHVMDGSCVFMGWSQSRQVIILPNFVAIGTVVVEISWFSLSRDLTRPR